MSYTKGPWIIGDHQKIISVGWSIRTTEDYSAVAYVLGDKNPELKENATLIAAAPELLEALEAIIAITDRKHDAWDAAKAVIKKAKGQP